MVSVSTATTTAVGAALGLVLVVWPLAIWLEVRKCEKPQYKVLRSLDTKRRLWWAQPAAEIRQYAPYLIAEVTVEGTNMTEALSQGFRQIANFIFGNNKGTAGSEKIDMTSPVVLEEPHEVRDTKKIRGGSGAKIAMTSPVATHMEDGKYRVSFIMPSKYTKETLPKPKNSNISIKEVPAHTLAALSWRGRRPTVGEVEQRKAELAGILKQHQIEYDSTSGSKLYQYYPPFAPSWLRLQDVLLPVKYEGSAAQQGKKAA